MFSKCILPTPRNTNRQQCLWLGRRWTTDFKNILQTKCRTNTMLKAYSNWLVELLFTIKCITSLFSSVQLPLYLSPLWIISGWGVSAQKKRPQNLGLPLTPNRSAHHESNNRLKAVPGLFWGIETTEKRMRFFHVQKLKANLFLNKNK